MASNSTNIHKETKDTSSSSDDDSEKDETDKHHSSPNRVKRCANGAFTLPKINIKWPPDRNDRNQWRNLRPIQRGNIRLGNKMQLYSRTRYFLGVYPDGTVRGTRDPNDLHTHLEITSADQPGDVRIRGMLSNLYVAMNRNGVVYADPDVTEIATIFVESLQGSYNSYLSRANAHKGWFLGIKKSGKMKKGPKTTYRQKAVNFLPDRSKFG